MSMGQDSVFVAWVGPSMTRVYNSHLFTPRVHTSRGSARRGAYPRQHDLHLGVAHLDVHPEPRHRRNVLVPHLVKHLHFIIPCKETISC